MALRYEGKRLREVKAYKRKSKSGTTVYVESYYQRYNKPRGGWNVLKKDSPTSSNKTIWLKDRAGRFVGRASNKKISVPKRKIASAGSDLTTNYRERGRYGRIKGRASAG
jgi:hypothetical protein